MSNELKKEEISQNLIPNEEEEKIDEELQKEMRNIKIDDSIFSNKEKKNSKEKKEKDDKKNQKKKELILLIMQMKIIFKLIFNMKKINIQ